MTQKQQIIDYLNQFGTITPMQAFRDLGITKLATRISEMKKDGISFNTETIKVKNRFGKHVPFCKYSLKRRKFLIEWETDYSDDFNEKSGESCIIAISRSDAIKQFKQHPPHSHASIMNIEVINNE